MARGRAGEVSDVARPSFVERARFAAALFAVAAGSALFAVAFREALQAVLHGLYRAPDILRAFRELPLPLRFVLPILGGLGAGLCASAAARAKAGSSVADVMEAVVLGSGRLSMRGTTWKALGSWLAIASGGSIGREGPLIQFGGAIGDAIGRITGQAPDRTRALIAAGTAAGFAAAYNTPFAAVLFVAEVVAGVLSLDVLLPVVAAVPIASAITRLLGGGGPIYGQRAFVLVSPLELGAYALLGAAAGLLAVGFMAALEASEGLFAKLRMAKAWRAGLGGAAVGALALALPEITGNGYEAINLILDGHLALGLLPVLVLGKALATCASVGSGAPGGVFTPSLMLGAALGAVAGTLVTAVAPGHAGGAGAYALVGMAALCAGTTHAPMMAAVLVFELSGDYAIVLPLLIATAMSIAVSRRLRPDSIYAAERRKR